jgi:hypothetical protein
MSTKDNVVQLFKKAAKPIQDKASTRIKGNNNIVGNSNTVVHNHGAKIKVEAMPDPGGRHITEPECAELSQMVSKICALSGKTCASG